MRVKGECGKGDWAGASPVRRRLNRGGGTILFYGNAFSEVSWFIDVVSSYYCGVVCEELEGEDGQEGLEDFECIRDLDQVVGVVFDVLIALCCDNDCFSASCANFFDIAHYFVVLWSFCSDEYSGHSVHD